MRDVLFVLVPVVAVAVAFVQVAEPFRLRQVLGLIGAGALCVAGLLLFSTDLVVRPEVPWGLVVFMGSVGVWMVLSIIVALNRSRFRTKGTGTRSSDLP